MVPLCTLVDKYENSTLSMYAPLPFNIQSQSFENHSTIINTITIIIKMTNMTFI